MDGIFFLYDIASVVIHSIKKEYIIIEQKQKKITTAMPDLTGIATIKE